MLDAMYYGYKTNIGVNTNLSLAGTYKTPNSQGYLEKYERNR